MALYPNLPYVLPEALLAIHDVLGIRGVGGDNIFLALVAFSFVEFPFVSQG